MHSAEPNIFRFLLWAKAKVVVVKQTVTIAQVDARRVGSTLLITCTSRTGEVNLGIRGEDASWLLSPSAAGSKAET